LKGLIHPMNENSSVEKDLYIAQLEQQVVDLIGNNYRSDDPMVTNEDRESGTCNVQFRHTLEALSDQDIYTECKRSPLVWKLVQVWKKKRSNGFIYSANFRLLEEDAEQHFQAKFIDFLSTLELEIDEIAAPNYDDTKTNALLVLNKQDFHFNKYDIFGNNNIFERLANFESTTVRLAQKAARNYNVDKIIYVIGSDSFNSEWTNTTTKGTPQRNMVSYHEGFEIITKHEIAVIADLLQRAQQVEVMYVPGNHDEYVGWHLIKMLEMAFKGEPRISFETTPFKRKYIRYDNTAMLFNHGDDAKPQKLVNAFPVEFKDEGSFTNHWYVFTGDKHQRLEKDFSGIEFYGIPALSTAKSHWDDLNAHVGTKAAYTAFIIEEGNGMADIYKEYMK
jgi:hypothetical protein